MKSDDELKSIWVWAIGQYWTNRTVFGRISYGVPVLLFLLFPLLIWTLLEWIDAVTKKKK